MSFRDEIIKNSADIIKNALKSAGIDEDSMVYEIPPSREMGDLAFPMFKYASVLKKNPAVIAVEVNEKIENNKLFKSTSAKGPYLNVFLNDNYIAEKILKQIIEKKEDFGKRDKNNIKVLIEFSSPNTNKPLHLGHCRNNVLGDSISRIYDFLGYDVVKLNLVNDRGIHICKSMLAYDKYGDNTTPEKEGKKSDHLVGDFYVKFAQESDKDDSLEKEAQAMLKKWEDGDPDIIKLWKKMNDWAISGIKETYKRMGILFTDFEYESINYLYGKDVVELGLDMKVFYKEEDGSTWIDNEDVGLDKKIVLRKDGTSVYMTQDLGTAYKRHEKYNFNELIYVVGSEQIYHFKTLFAILKKLGFDWAEKCQHLSYGMVNLPDGKMKSREGNVIDADNLMDLLHDLAYKVVDEKQKEMDNAGKDNIAEKIGLAALKYYLLNFSTAKDVMFDPEKSISFDGNTGPYLQYTTARINSLLLKNNNDINTDLDFDSYELNKDENNVVMHLLNFEKAVQKACENLSPVEICSYLYELARLYNKFYHDNPVIKAETEELKRLRLMISKASHIVLKNGIKLLGFSPLDKM